MKAPPISLRQTFHLIKSDLRARARYEGRKPGAWSTLGLFFTPGVLALSIWRFEVWIYRRGIPLVPKLIALTMLVLFAAELEPEAEIGEGFIILNPIGIMVHGHVRIGRDCIFAHQITTALGPRVGFDPVNDYIIIEDNVVISAGTRIIGNLSIGRNTWVGPNTIVTDSLPAESIVVGKTIRPRGEAGAA
jgi:serine O-acetyltransferase